MKKLCLLLLIISLLCGCEKQNDKNTTNQKDETQGNIVEDENKVDDYIDTNPIKVSLYQNTSEALIKLGEYKNNWTSKNDIVVLTSILTNEEKVYGNYFQDIWEEYYKKYSNIDNYKIGYFISFQLEDGTILEKNILSPKDGLYFYGYISIYLYDDFHQEKGKWYRHIEENEVLEDTIFTSIKLTAEEKIKKIISPITVTTFTYDENDFDEFGNYRGISKYAITIKNE